MQTLTEVAKDLIRWERTPLPGGAHRIHGIARLDTAPALEFRDCSYDEWFADDLISVKSALGIVGGVWCGVATAGLPQVVLALMLE